MTQTLHLHDVFIGVGSNVGRRIAHLQQAITGLREIGVCDCSAVYETTPVGLESQPDFLNMVVHLQTRDSPRETLRRLQGIEERAHRERTIRFGPRTLDLDILLFDDIYHCVTDLQIPHARMWERAFALVPLADIVPNRRGLGGQRIGLMAQAVDQKEGVRYVGRFW